MRQAVLKLEISSFTIRGRRANKAMDQTPRVAQVIASAFGGSISRTFFVDEQ